MAIVFFNEMNKGDWRFNELCSANTIGDLGAKEFCEPLRVNRTLTHLSLFCEDHYLTMVAKRQCLWVLLYS